MLTTMLKQATFTTAITITHTVTCMTMGMSTTTTMIPWLPDNRMI